MKTKEMCRMALVAALYVALTTLNPLSWGAVQFRVANVLCAIPLVKKSYAPAVLLGIAIANAASPFGPVDVLFGLAAEGIAYAWVVWGPLKWMPAVVKAFILSLCVALIVGSELVLMTGAPFWAVGPGLLVGTLAAAEAGVFILDHTPLGKVI